MKTKTIEGFINGLQVAISSCVIVSKKFALEALRHDPDGVEREPYATGAAGAITCTRELVKVMRQTICEIAGGDDLSLYPGQGDDEEEPEPKECGAPDAWREVNSTPVDGKN